MRGPVLLIVLILASGCGSTGPGPSLAEMNAESRTGAPVALARAHSEAIPQRAPTSSVDPIAVVSPQELQRQVQEIDAEIARMLADRAGVPLFRDFSTPESRRRQETARDLASLAPALADGIDQSEFEDYVFARSPRITAAYEQLRSAVERYPQVVYVEVILAQYVTFLSDLMLGVGPRIHLDPVALKYPTPGVLALKADLVSREVDLAREEFERVVRDVIVAADVALYQDWYLGRALAIEREVLDYLRQLESTVRSRLETGNADKSQVIQVQVEISALEDDVITLEERRRTIRARLRELLDVGPAMAVGEPSLPEALPGVAADEATLSARALEQRQEIRLARDRVRRVGTAIELAEKMTYPDWTLGLGYFRGIRPVGESAQGQVAGGVVPSDFGQRPPAARTFWFGHNEAYLREVRTLRRALEQRLEAERRAAEFAVREQSFALDEARRKLALYDQILITQARQAYEDTLAGYQSDRVEFLNVIDTLRQWLRFDLERDRARRDYLTARARLEAAVGETIAP